MSKTEQPVKGAEEAASPAAGVTWVRASERLPEDGKTVHIITGNGEKNAAWYNEDSEEWYWHTEEVKTLNESSLNGLMWLDESNQREEQQSDAVAFAEWISKEGYISTTLAAEPVQLWQANVYNREADTLTEGQEITSQELYNLFKSENNL